MIVLYEHGKVADAATNTAGIYYWRNNINSKGYIGKSLNLQSRMSAYTGMWFKAQRVFYAAVKKYGLENFICYKVMDCCPSDVALNYWETFWIRELNTFIDGGHGYNMTTGGDGGKLSVETRQKMSDARRGENNPNYGKKFSDEHRKKIGDAQRGKTRAQLSDEHRKKIGDALRGKKLSAETRKKIGDANRGENNPNYGKKLSDEHRKKLIDAWVRRRKSKRVHTGTLYSEFFIF